MRKIIEEIPAKLNSVVEDLFEEIYEKGPEKVLWICPNHRLTRVRTAQWASFVKNKGRKAALLPDFSTLNDLAVYSYEFGNPDFRCVSEIERVSILIEAIQEALSDSYGFYPVSDASIFITELKSHLGKDPDFIKNTVLNAVKEWRESVFYPLDVEKPDLIAERINQMLEVFEKYEALKNERGLFDVQDAFYAEPVVSGEQEVLIIDSFQDFDPCEKRFLEALEQKFESIFVIKPRIFIPDELKNIELGVNGKIAVSFDEFETPVVEIEEIARRVKGLIDAGVSPESILVVFPELNKIAHIVRALFLERGIDVNISTGVPLSKTALGEVLFNILLLVEDGTSNERFFDIFRSPLFVMLDYQSLKKLENRLLKDVKLSKIENYLQVIDDFLANSDDSINNEFKELVADVSAAIKDLNSSSTNLDAYQVLVGFAEKAYELFKSKVPESKEIYERLLSFMAASAFRSSFKNKKDLQWIKYLLQKILDTGSKAYRGDVASGVQITGVLETRGQNADFIFMAGFTDDVFPALSRKSFIVPEGVKELLKLPTTSDYFRKQKEDFYRLFSSARYGVFLSSARTEARDSKEESRFSAELRHYIEVNTPDSVILFDWNELVSPSKKAVQIDIFGYADRDYEGEWAKIYEAEKKDQKPVIYVTSIASLVDCDYRFFLNFLNISPSQYPPYIASVKEVGSFAHSVIAKALSSKELFEKTKEIIESKGIEKAVSYLKEVMMDEILENEAVSDSFDEKSISNLSSSLSYLIADFVEKQLEGYETKLEFDVEKEYRDAILKGRIDAVLLAPDKTLFSIYDFKYIPERRFDVRQSKGKKEIEIKLADDEKKRNLIQLAAYAFLLGIDLPDISKVQLENVYLSEASEVPLYYRHEIENAEEIQGYIDKAVAIAAGEISPSELVRNSKNCMVCYLSEVCFGEANE